MGAVPSDGGDAVSETSKVHLVITPLNSEPGQSERKAPTSRWKQPATVKLPAYGQHVVGALSALFSVLILFSRRRGRESVFPGAWGGLSFLNKAGRTGCTGDWKEGGAYKK